MWLSMMHLHIFLTIVMFLFSKLYIFQKHLRAFGQVSRKCGVPIFLFHPLVSSFSTQNSNELQEVKSDPCQLCHHRTIVFGVKDAEWQEKQTESLATLVVSLCSLTWSLYSTS